MDPRARGCAPLGKVQFLGLTSEIFQVAVGLK